MKLAFLQHQQKGDWLPLAAAWFVGLVLIVSAVAKMASLGAFELYVVQQQLLPTRVMAAYAVRLLLAAELFLGLAFFGRAWLRRLTLPATAAMLLGFSFYLAYLAFIKKDSGSCHCFGDLISMSPRESLLKNLVLLALVAYLYRRTRAWVPGSWRVPAVVAAASLLVIGVAFPVRQIDVQPVPGAAAAKPSRFAVFRQFSENTAFDLTRGTVLVAFVSLECEHCRDLVTQLGTESQQQALPPVYLLCLGEEAAAPEFLAATGTAFPYACISPEQFFDFIGERPPRLYLLEGGVVRAFWDTERFERAQLAAWWPAKPEAGGGH